MRQAEPRETEPRETGLEMWIRAATRGLSDEATARIGSEIRDHFLEATAEAIRAGRGDDEATRTALATLGDPHVAARAFRRHNLRRWEAGIVKGLDKPPPGWIVVLYVAMLPAFLAVCAGHLDGAAQITTFGLCLLSMIGGILARFWISRRLARRGRLRSALVTDILSSWFVYAPLCVGSLYIVGSSERQANAMLYAAILLVLLFLIAHLWPKLSERA